MNKAILNIEIQDFINSNLKSDITKLLLKGTAFEAVDTKAVIEQIEAKRRCATKLPTWYHHDNIYYPNKLHIEQTSSEITAKYKADLIEGQSLIDLTGGFGVDSFYFAKRFKHVVHCEMDQALHEIVSHNYMELGCDHIECLNTDGIAYLQHNDVQYDWMYIDPSRRHETKGKVFFLKDCLPNVPIHLNLLFKRSKQIMIKTSPLLDISAGIRALNFVKTIHVIAVHNEVKELLWILERDYTAGIEMKTVNIKGDTIESFNFLLEEETALESQFSAPLTYLYEPNSAIMKSGGFNALSNRFALPKLHRHSHLYVSHERIHFPGRTFKIVEVLPYGKKLFKKLGITKANITTRNFPETVQHIRKKLNIRDGGDTYLFFTTDYQNNLIVIVSERV